MLVRRHLSAPLPTSLFPGRVLASGPAGQLDGFAPVQNGGWNPQSPPRLELAEPKGTAPAATHRAQLIRALHEHWGIEPDLNDPRLDAIARSPAEARFFLDSDNALLFRELAPALGLPADSWVVIVGDYDPTAAPGPTTLASMTFGGDAQTLARRLVTQREVMVELAPVVLDTGADFQVSFAHALSAWVDTYGPIDVLERLQSLPGWMDRFEFLSNPYVQGYERYLNTPAYERSLDLLQRFQPSSDVPNPESRAVFVRATEEQLELIEALVEHFDSAVPFHARSNSTFGYWVSAAGNPEVLSAAQDPSLLTLVSEILPTLGDVDPILGTLLIASLPPEERHADFLRARIARNRHPVEDFDLYMEDDDALQLLLYDFPTFDVQFSHDEAALEAFADELWEREDSPYVFSDALALALLMTTSSTLDRSDHEQVIANRLSVAPAHLRSDVPALEYSERPSNLEAFSTADLYVIGLVIRSFGDEGTRRVMAETVLRDINEPRTELNGVATFGESASVRFLELPSDLVSNSSVLNPFREVAAPIQYHLHALSADMAAFAGPSHGDLAQDGLHLVITPIQITDAGNGTLVEYNVDAYRQTAFGEDAVLDLGAWSALVD